MAGNALYGETSLADYGTQGNSFEMLRSPCHIVQGPNQITAMPRVMGERHPSSWINCDDLCNSRQIVYTSDSRSNRLILDPWEFAKTKMIVQGIVHNGCVIPSEPLTVPDGTHVTIEIVLAEESQTETSLAPRQGGWLKGQVTIAPDFDELPDDIREAFGMN